MSQTWATARLDQHDKRYKNIAVIKYSETHQYHKLHPFIQNQIRQSFQYPWPFIKSLIPDLNIYKILFSRKQFDKTTRSEPITQHQISINYMKYQQFTYNPNYEFQEQAFYNQLTLQQIQYTNPQEIFKIIMQKNQLIQDFSKQITKFKAESIKAKKLIASLQQKVQKVLPSGTNTSSSFMIASQFKTLFTTFMTNTLPSVLYEFIEHPKLYALLLKSIFQGVYFQIRKIIQRKTEAILGILIEDNLNSESFQQAEQNSNAEQTQKLRQQIRYHLLNFLQKYSKKIFPTRFQLDLTGQQKNSNESDQSFRFFFKVIVEEDSHFNEEIRQKLQALNSELIQQSDQVKQFCTDLYQICVYMVLQQNPWQFVFDNTEADQKKQFIEQKRNTLFTKKQFTCIDGFLKQGNEVQMILKGLRRKQNNQKDFHYHPNIKNFVLPVNVDEQVFFTNTQFQTKVYFLAKIQEEEKEHQKDTQFNDQKMQNAKDFKRNQTHKNNDSEETQNNLLKQKQKSFSQQSLRIEDIPQTQKSQFIQSLLVPKQKPLIQNQSNCIIDSTQTYIFIQQDPKPIRFDDQENKENFNKNINLLKQDKKLFTNSKKQKSLLDKNMIKKIKKQKAHSTIDLTTQKYKTTHKDTLKENFQNQIHKKKHQDFPLSRQIPKSSKKKGVGKSSRKCSVGKIVSQSTQMTGSNIHLKQKIPLSQHNTVIMKQSAHIKNLKQNHFNEANQRTNMENKQNLSNFVGHMYEKQIIRPKKSTKISKNDEKQIFVTINQGQKQDRPLALRAYQNNCLVGKLREKYLIN